MKRYYSMSSLIFLAAVSPPAGADDPPPAKKEAPAGWEWFQPKDIPFRVLLPAAGKKYEPYEWQPATDGFFIVTDRAQSVDGAEGMAFVLRTASYRLRRPADTTAVFRISDHIRRSVQHTERAFDPLTSESKQVKVRGTPAIDFFFTREGAVVRGRGVYAADNVFVVTVQAKDKAAVTSKEIDAYLDSIEYVPPPKKAVEPKKAEPGKEPTKDN